MAYDLLIKNAKICDGTGAPTSYASVAVEGGKIVEVGQVAGSAKREINGTDLVVAPGFIDPHTHYDAQICWDSLLTSSCWHGVTTVLMGNCGIRKTCEARRNREDGAGVPRRDECRRLRLLAQHDHAAHGLPRQAAREPPGRQRRTRGAMPRHARDEARHHRDGADASNRHDQRRRTRPAIAPRARKPAAGHVAGPARHAGSR